MEAAALRDWSSCAGDLKATLLAARPLHHNLDSRPVIAWGSRSSADMNHLSSGALVEFCHKFCLVVAFFSHSHHSPRFLARLTNLYQCALRCPSLKYQRVRDLQRASEELRDLSVLIRAQVYFFLSFLILCSFTLSRPLCSDLIHFLGHQALDCCLLCLKSLSAFSLLVPRALSIRSVTIAVADRMLIWHVWERLSFLSVFHFLLTLCTLKPLEKRSQPCLRFSHASPRIHIASACHRT